MKVQIDIDVPDGVIDQQFEVALREDGIYRLFAERKIASGHAARLLGLTRRQFLDSLRQRGLSHTDYSAADWIEDAAALDRMIEPGHDGDHR